VNNEVTEKMFAGLRELMEDTAGWGVLVLMQWQGDVPFLAPVTPKLRGWEIVSDGGGKYDLWKDGSMRRYGLTKPQVQAWLAQRMPSERKFEEKVVLWTQQTLDHYGVARKKVGG